MSTGKGKRYIFESNIAKRARLDFPPTLIKHISKTTQNYKLTVRVLYKNGKRTKNGSYCFNLILMDSSGCIAMCGWFNSENDNPLNKGLQVGKCYEVKGSGAREFPCKSMQFSWIRHPFQLMYHFNNIEILETGDIVPLWCNIYNPTPFSSVRAAKTEIIDVVGYVVSFIPYYGQGDSQDLKYYELKLKDVKNQQIIIIVNRNAKVAIQPNLEKRLFVVYVKGLRKGYTYSSSSPSAKLHSFFDTLYYFDPDVGETNVFWRSRWSN